MIAKADRNRRIVLIDEAVVARARDSRACDVLEVNVRTLQRWKQALKPSEFNDQRKAAALPLR
jgi:hypothetical protein